MWDTFNTVSLWVIVGVAVSVVVAFAAAALMGGGRSAQGGPRHGSLERDEDHDPGGPHA